MIRLKMVASNAPDPSKNNFGVRIYMVRLTSHLNSPRDWRKMG